LTDYQGERSHARAEPRNLKLMLNSNGISADLKSH
jgi:hypothetical protein